MRSLLKLISVASLLAATYPAIVVHADEFTVQIQGIEGPLLANVRAGVETFRISGNTRLSRGRLERLRSETELRAAMALRPYGYYHPDVRSELRSTGERAWVLDLTIEQGPPVVVDDLSLEITGPGSMHPELQQWRKEWPLKPGARLDQTRWETQKRAALDWAEAKGFLRAEFREHRIELDLLQNQADLVLHLHTGERALMGKVFYQQQFIKPGVLDSVPRFEEGQPYDHALVEEFRMDLWKTGYFANVEVVEEERPEESPPRVNLIVRTEPRPRNSWQGSIGVGSDTGIRLQTLYTRHVVSSSGDSLDVGAGWQERDNEFSLRTTYRYPRRVKTREFWMAEAFFRKEQQNLAISPDDQPERLVSIAAGTVRDFSVKPGLLRIHDVMGGRQQISEHWYVQYLNDNSSLRPSPQGTQPPLMNVIGDGLSGSDRLSTESWAVGVSWDWPAVSGKGFKTSGHRERAWLFTSNTAWGSDIDFTQLYLASHWNTIWKDRWKLLLRGEIGYSDAEVFEQVVRLDDESFSISVSELPHLYRFRAGGGQSVRGYGFERLSNNNIGSNHLLTASAELEMEFRPNWSVAAFFDIGNAFNHWSDTDLRKGIGLGIRWYSIAGPFRLDVAQALDEPGRPWRVHFTIGSPLL